MSMSLGYCVTALVLLLCGPGKNEIVELSKYAHQVCNPNVVASRTGHEGTDMYATGCNLQETTLGEVLEDKKIKEFGDLLLQSKVLIVKTLKKQVRTS
jgi:hypothetical protein